MSTLDARIAQDKLSATISLPTGHNCMTVNAEGLSELIAFLGALQTKMKPVVAAKLSQLKPVLALKDPTFTVTIDQMGNQPMLQVRDPRYGWLHYTMPAKMARELASALATAAQQAEAATSAPQPPTAKH